MSAISNINQPSSSTSPAIDWSLFQKEIPPCSKAAISNKESVFEAFRNLDPSRQAEINAKFLEHRTKESAPLLIEENIPRPLFITDSDMYVIFEKNKPEFGDLRIGKGSYKNVYFAVSVNTGKIRAYYSIKGDLKRHIGELEIAKTTGCGPKVFGYTQRSSDSRKFQGAKLCAVVKLFDGDVEQAFRSSLIDLGTEAAKIELLKKMLDELALFHSKNYIHRDIKLANFLINIKKNGYDVKITDFGYSIPKTLQDFARRGSPLFMAPEAQFPEMSKRGVPGYCKNFLTEKLDSWALGMSWLEECVLSGLFPKSYEGYYLYNQLVSEFLDPEPSTLPAEAQIRSIQSRFQLFITNLYFYNDDWLPMPDESKTLEFVIWNLLRKNHLKRWSPEEALKYLSSCQISETPS